MLRCSVTFAAIALLHTATSGALPDALPDLSSQLKFGPGYEPHRAKGERGPGQARPCTFNYFKNTTGAFPCQLCPAGYIAPTEGATKCKKCQPRTDYVGDKDRTPDLQFCLMNPTDEEKVKADLANKPVPSYTGSANQRIQGPGRSAAKLMPSNLRVYQRDWKALANIPLPPLDCANEEMGSKRCRIPVGWWDNDRSGSVFFPQEYNTTAIPYMMLLHGSGWTGSDMINIFKEYAIRYKFGIVAPDSHNKFYWSSPDFANQTFTADFYHMQGCWDAVFNATNFPGVVADPAFLASFGNSFAAYAATSFASRATTDFTSAAVLHGAALPQQMGPRTFPIQWITGSLDPLYGPKAAGPDVTRFRAEQPLYDVSWQIWKDGHTIRNYTQIEHMVKWWLDPAIRNDTIVT